MRAGRATTDDRGLGGLDGVGQEGGVLLFEVARRAADRAAGADAGDEDIEIAAGVGPELGAGGGFVDRRVGGVFKLLRDPGAGGDRGQFLRPLDGAAHPELGRGQDEFGAEAAQEGAALQAEGFGHREGQVIPLGGGDEGQCDAGIAAGGLDDARFGGQDAVLFRLLDHGTADAVLDRGQRVEELELGQDGGVIGRDEAAQTDERRLKGGLDDGVVDLAAQGKRGRRSAERGERSGGGGGLGHG